MMSLKFTIVAFSLMCDSQYQTHLQIHKSDLFSHVKEADTLQTQSVPPEVKEEIRNRSLEPRSVNPSQSRSFLS